MKPSSSVHQITYLSLFLRLVAIIICFNFVSLAAPPAGKVAAQAKVDDHQEADSTPTLLSTSDIQQLVSVLEDSTQRKEFLKTLRLLAKVQASQRPSKYITGEGGLLFSLIQPVQDGLGSLSKWIRTTFADIRDLPTELHTIRQHVLDQSALAVLSLFLLGLGVAVFAGLIIEFG